MEMTAYFKGHTDATEGVSKAGNPWRKVTAVFETVEHFSKTIAVSALNSVCEQVLTDLKPGQLYRVNFDIESRAWTDPKTKTEKWFTDCKAWSIVPAVQSTQPVVAAGPKFQDMANFDKPLPPLSTPRATQTSVGIVPPEDNPNDDIPF